MPEPHRARERSRRTRQAPILRRVCLWALAVCLVACTANQRLRLGRRHGPQGVRDREVASLADGAIDYWTQVRPILESRCVVCHGCYDAPCQVKLGSPEGIDRGASEDRVYDALRPLKADTTRLFEDAQSTGEWRDKGFYPIVNERSQTVAASREAGLMLQLLELKRDHPVVAGAPLPEDVDITLGREHECPTVEELPRHARKHPEWGMPYGLPGLDRSEHNVLVQWLEEGALHVAARPPPPQLLTEVARWEALLNRDDLRSRLASRYIFEHLFLAHLYFDDGPSDGAPQFFEMVRSRTPPGTAIDRIGTRRPYDDPGVARPYYRLSPVRESLVAKLHLPYRLDRARMARWRELFFDAEFPVTALPAYTAEVASNPFESFHELPVPSRYRFMLDESEFTIMGFIKGAVCRGPIALNVINDHFHIFFIDPDLDTKLFDAKFLHDHADDLRMPAAAGSSAPPVRTWMRDAARQKSYMDAKEKVIQAEFGTHGVKLDMLWDGDGHNPNAALTVFRHFDSASVVRGMVGDPPKTAWVLGYPLLERIHYLLVAGFDVYGNVGHQLATRTAMDFLRMEAEFTFLGFVPPAARKKERDFWYRGAPEPLYAVLGRLNDIDVRTDIQYKTATPKLELYEMLRERFAPVSEGTYTVGNDGVTASTTTALSRLGSIVGVAASRLPEVSFLLVPDGAQGPAAFSLIRNSAHLNVAQPLLEDKRRARTEDTLTVARGFVGTYPNALFVVPEAELADFAEGVSTLRLKPDYVALHARFGVGRTDAEFWPTVDEMHALFRRMAPIKFGVFDLSRVAD